MKKAFSILMMAGLFLFFGCNDITELEKNTVAESIEDTSETSNEEVATSWLRFAKPVLSNEARTALPEFDSDILESCSFVLKGALSTEETQQDFGSFESLAALSGASLACAEGTWNFTLTASNSGTVFTGSLNGVEIKSGSNELDFELSWDKTALTGKGSLNFTLDFSAASNASAVKLATAELLSWNPTTKKETALESYTETEIGIKDDKVTYIITDLDAGNYRVKIHLYADTEKQHPINTWRELAIVTGGQTSLASRTMASLNKVYKIEYVTDGGTPEGSETLPEVYTRNSAKITLPRLIKNGAAFSGWYLDKDYTSAVVTELAGGSTGDKTLYAKWSKAAIKVEIEELQDISMSYDIISEKEVKFTVTGGTSPYTWNFYRTAQGEPEDQSETGSTFTFDASALSAGVYEIEAISSDDLSCMATVFVGGADAYLYVSATGDDGNNGTASKPLATIAAAVAKMDDSDIDYTIFVDGMLGRSHDTSGLTAGQSIAEVEAVETTTDSGSANYGYKATNAILAKSITVKGLNELVNGEPVDGIDTDFGAETNGKTTPVLLVATSVPVTIENLKLAGGWGKNGEALAVGFSRALIGEEEATNISADVTIKDGVLITDSGNGTTEVPSPIYSAAVRTVSAGSILRMEGGSITGNTAGLGVLSVTYGSTFEMTGGFIKDNTLYTGSTANSISCGVRVMGQPSDGSLAAGIFKISGDAVVDEVCPGTGAVVTVAGALKNSDKIQILPSSYTDGTQVLAVTSDVGVTLAEASAYFTVKPNDGTFWTLYTDGKIYEGYISSVAELGSTLSSLDTNDVSTPYKVTITDNASNFISINTSLTNALETAGKYVTITYKNASFTSMEGTLSEYITSLTIPDSVTASGMGFLDLGENFSEFAVASSNSKFSVSGGKLYSADGTKLYRVPPTYTGTSLPILAKVTDIADGFIVGCKNIASFTVASGNTSFKVTTGGALSSLNDGLAASQIVDYFKYDSSISTTAPEQFTSDGKWNTEYETWSNSVSYQHVSYGYVTIGGLLTSYDGKTLIACPPALKLYTDDDIKELCGGYEKDQNGSNITYKAYSNFNLNFTSVKPYAFAGCDSLKIVNLAVNSTTASTAYTFYNCANITSITFYSKGSTISAYTFTNCAELGSVSFSSTTTTKIESKAFEGCTKLKSMYFEAGELTGKSAVSGTEYATGITITGKVN